MNVLSGYKLEYEDLQGGAKRIYLLKRSSWLRYAMTRLARMVNGAKRG